ncbi:MAG: nucleotidyltransferase domain-containing protein [Candidatus Goldbacteria bacterium]|nr:nucleotidyltransferase domain-containing protein [Candidatus Goldiibacteriota bacterium]
MKINSGVLKVLNSEDKIKILKFMLGQKKLPDMSERELSRVIGVSNVKLNRALAEFKEINLAEVKGVGNSNVWAVNESSYAYSVLKPIIDSAGEKDVPFADMAERIKKAFGFKGVKQIKIFGSVARKKEAVTSDIDVFVLVKDNRTKEECEIITDKLSAEFVKLYGNVLNGYILTEKEYKDRKNLALIGNIEKEGIKIV